VAEQLNEEERVAAGAGVEVGGQFGGAGAGADGDEVGHVGDGQLVEPQVLDRPVPQQPGQDAGERVGAVGRLRPVGGEDEQRHRRDRTGRRLEQLDRVAVGPVEILDQHHQRPLGRRRRAGRPPPPTSGGGPSGRAVRSPKGGGSGDPWPTPAVLARSARRSGQGAKAGWSPAS
jgi:hypothetical protein